MNIPVIWKRPHLSFPLTFDTIFFDVDGVLIKTKASFQATAIAVAEYVVGIIHGHDWGLHEGKSLVTIEDVEAFKRAGGFQPRVSTTQVAGKPEAQLTGDAAYMDDLTRGNHL